MSIESEGSRSESNEHFDQTKKVLNVSVVAIKKSPAGIAKSNCKELIEYEEKTITSNLGNVGPIKSEYDEDHWDEDDWDEESEEESDEEIETEIIKESLVVTEIGIPEQKAKKIMVEEQRIEENNLKSAPTSTTVKKQTTPGAIHPRIVSKPTKTEPIPVADGYCSVPKRHSKLQSLVDLVMWRDESRSAFIFGMGTSVIMSSSYTTDLNISLITVLSYVGLIYLAVTFLFRSLRHRSLNRW
ncbi:uncharacterized protein LOC141700926 isoform X1 [Apium graveolens]|uniref:uncharacterized protein LOC141700926 isoform X1 n=1 Tax=Apium graveolens TaxID=4045 RepID=UPI003D79ECFA